MTGIKLFLVLMLLTGLVYPVVITLFAQLLFPGQANGDPYLIGQRFDQDKYFWPRPSATGYNTLPAGGSNLSATSKNLKEMIVKRKAFLLAADKTKTEKQIPSDLLLASGSGLDPHISIAAAIFQVERVAKARQIDKDNILAFISRATERKQLFIFGEDRVNVLRLNQLLDNHSLKGVK